MAAFCPSNTILSLKKNPANGSFRAGTGFLVSHSAQRSQFGPSKTLSFGTKKGPTTAIPKVLSKTNESSPSIITELDKQQDHRQQRGDGFTTNKQETAERKLGDVWREIHGQDDWVGMIDPMDPILRSELIRYGEMAQASYDAFDFDPFSKYCGSCRFMQREFFNSLEMSHHGYDVSRYLYATSNINLPNFFKKSRWPKMWSKNANWMGYVAVSNDETTKRLGRRDITIAWRGTVTRLEWIADLMDFLKPFSNNKIPSREQILTEVKRLLELYYDEDVSITVTGHSLGSALAILSAYDIVETGINVLRDSRAVPVCVYSFSGPRVGNVRFKERIEILGLKVLRVINVHDVVPKTPGFLFNENVSPVLMKMAEGFPWSYSHVGVELALDHKNSPFLNPAADPTCAHNLEALLHLLDGYHGKGHRFVLASGRDPALVNKASDFLKDHYLVPPYWRQNQNKGLVRSKDGRWVQPERPKLDDHPPNIHNHLKQLGLAHSEHF
ncbi:phospholipase A1-Igamma2 [Citrus sinensis]|uniref:Phospholipase A1-Igamma2 n=1 Tax=Citrus sinensis TaxID=2711 RepID=A0ACB8MJE5_CITSI|nr:phospholipase A1-Igamma2 [Citrus sinensis]